MKCEVDGQFKKFYLAFQTGWEPFHGHEIKIGEYRFAVGGISTGIMINEVTTGSRIKVIPMSIGVYAATSTREDTLKFYSKVVVPLLMAIVKTKDFDKKLKVLQKEAFERLGATPAPEIADDSIIREPISNLKN